MTERVIHNLVQGTPEWLEFRLKHFGASEAAAMLGLSSKVKRTELLHMKHTGTAKEFSDWVQKNILDYGHEVEALARPIVEEMIGEELYPVTCSLGELSASTDGLTMSDDDVLEHKQWNEALAESLLQGVLPEEHQPQSQQILMVTGARRLRFVCSDGTRNRFVWLEVLPDAAWFDRLRAGWAQFKKDLAEYVPQAVEVKPVGRAPETLPALRIEVTGQVVASNLADFKTHALAVLGNINRELKTDQDFADAAKTVTWCEDVESRLAAAKQHALSQTQSIDALFSAIDDISAEARTIRLELTKLVDKRKTEIKDSALVERRRKFTEHVATLDAELKVVRLEVTTPDFAAAAKGKRTLATLYDALDTALANGKIAASEAAQALRTKLAWFQERAKEHGFLFRDLQQVAQKPMEDFQLTVTTRIDQHNRDEEQRRATTAAAATTPAVTATAAAPTLASAPAAAPVTHRPSPTGAAPAALATSGCPSAADIVGALATHYRVEAAKVIGWLRGVDWRAYGMQGQQSEKPLPSYAEMLRNIQRCSDIDALDELEYQARTYPQNERVKLMQAYEDRRNELVGA